MSVCPKCGAPSLEGSLFCDVCGARLGPDAPLSPQPPATATIPCPSCGAAMLPGETFCGHCGAPLHPSPALTCDRCGAALQPGSRFCDRCGAAVPAAAPAPAPPPAAPSAPLPAGSAALRGWLIVQATGAELVFPPAQEELIIGREDAASGVFPDMDMSRHGGEVAGVSRRHARLVRRGDQLFVEDLHSTNATYVNRLRLNPGQLYPLNDGDELRLGQLKLQYRADRG